MTNVSGFNESILFRGVRYIIFAQEHCNQGGNIIVTLIIWIRLLHVIS